MRTPGDLSQVHLVAEPKATWHVVDEFPGPVSLLDNSWARMVIGDELARRAGNCKRGATVAHSGVLPGRVHGVRSDHLRRSGSGVLRTCPSTCRASKSTRTWRSELNRFHSIEHKEWERIVRNRPILRRVRGVDGGELYTDELLLTYLEQFEKGHRRHARPA